MKGDWEVLDSRFRVLVVCTGNICRSPLAAAYLQSRFDELSPGRFEISSAGTHGVVNGAVPRQIARLAADFGLSLESFRGRVLSAEMLTGADLILTMERRQRSIAVQLEPRSLRRAFTVREFARILPAVPPENGIPAEQRWQSLVALAQRYRQPTVGSLALDDVIDPYGRSAATYREMIEQLLPALRGIVEWERQAKRARP
ncbi:low molecular weight phosphatase family protein [Brevibacterium sp.]|uniref:arsenate reductase/protein-tyrosine-phosphatase family protein n=1 Tax=Brevibacterium sp. TaxID=1701 RepID=UPI00281254A4|nr:low molecular weight phosphatase family protein [Brevibacterium sp.]